MSGYIGTKSVTLSTTSASVGGDSTVGGDLTVDTNTLYVDSANNRVGVGTASPSNPFQVGTSDLIVDSSGRVGIGTSSPTSELTIGADSPQIDFYKTSSADVLANIRAETDAGSGGKLVFQTKRNGDTALDRMTIDDDGNMMVGKNAADNTTAGGSIFAGVSSFVNDGARALTLVRNTSNGDIVEFRKGTTTVGSISVSATTTSYNTSSDHRLKENVTDVTDGITRVKQLEPKRFNFIADPDTTVDGFLAHQAQTVVPEAVTGTHNEVDGDGNAVMQGIDQSKLVPLLTAALKESIAKIEALEARVTALEGN